MLAKVREAKPNARKPLPLVWKPGGVANVDTSSTVHQMNVKIVKRKVR